MDGLTEAEADGLMLGDREGLAVGLSLGETEELAEGEADGETEALVLGLTDPLALGLTEGLRLGEALGEAELYDASISVHDPPSVDFHTWPPATAMISVVPSDLTYSDAPSQLNGRASP